MSIKIRRKALNGIVASLGCHFLCFGLATEQARAEVAQSADNFVDRMGINTHIGGMPYDAVKYGQLGMRHIRDNLAPDTTIPGYARCTALYSTYGIRTNVVCDRIDAARTLALYQAFLENPQFESIEGLNEPDKTNPPRVYGAYSDTHNPPSYSATVQFQTDLYNAMKADVATKNKPVLSPAMAEPSKSLYINGVLCDKQAIHSYPGGEMPTGGSLDNYQIAGVQTMSSGGTSPIVCTETGYISGTATNDISDGVAAKYLPRLFAEYFNRGIERTYIFEMVDAVGYYDFGLLRNDLSIKPSYTHLQNLITLLKEATWNSGTQTWSVPSFTAGNLDYTMTGGNASVHHTLLQKSNGDFYLLLWQEVPSYNLTLHSDISNARLPVTLAFNTPLSSAATYQLSSTTATATYASPTTLTLNVPDELLVVKLTPNTSYVAPASPAVSILATDASATQTPVDTGNFTVTRAGSTTAALTVSYTLGGTAVSGTDYAALPGSVTIPAGAASATITVSPTAITPAQGTKNVIATLSTSGSYNVAKNRTAEVQLVVGNGLIEDFEDNNLLAPYKWTGNSQSTLSSLAGGDANSLYALRWQYNGVAGVQWSNSIKLSFTPAQDWTGVSKIRIRFAEDSGNPASNISQKISFDYANNGSRVNGGAGVTSFSLSGSTVYRTIEFDLGRYQRDHVDYLMFFLDGYAFANGTHIFYIDNITALSDSGSVLGDFEASALTNWTAVAPRSVISRQNTTVDTGAYALKWLYNDDGVTQWSNTVSLNFLTAVDWRRKSKLVLRFRADAANPASDVGQPVYIDWINNGVSASNSQSVAHFTLAADTAFRTITLDLGSFPRDKVSRLNFNVNGNNLATGNHIWYLDNVTLF